jgi:regulator of sigma E protease
MHNLHEIVIAVVAFIVLIGVMVVVHEFGHFAVAKLCGVRVESFSVGFGPRLFGIKRGDTDYKVCLLPLGGYVKMTGENPSELPGATPDAAASGSLDDPGSFAAHPRWQRMLIGVAGPIANFILAFVLMFFYYAYINEVPKTVVDSTTVEWVVPNSPAAQAGLHTGDVIRKFDSVTNPDWSAVGVQASMSLDQTVPLIVDRAGQQVSLSLHIPSLPKGKDFDFTDVGILPQFTPGPIGVEEVQAGTPAAEAGLRAGDAIETVDGQSFHAVPTLLAYMQTGSGKPLSLGILRNGARSTLVARPQKVDSEWKLGFASVPTPVRNDPLSFGKAAEQSKIFCINNSTTIVEVVGRLFTRKVAVSQLSGPVGIARMAGQAAQMQGSMPKFYLASAISLNLGILNLMPFPILDGGLILLLLIESVLRHDISLNVKERIYQAAFVVLVVFFAFIIFNDVTKLPLFTHLKP